MSDANVLQGTTLLVEKGIVDLIEGVETFNDMAKDGMPTIEIFDIIRESDEELRPASRRVRRGYRHGHRPPRNVLQACLISGGKYRGGFALPGAGLMPCTYDASDSPPVPVADGSPV